MVRSTWEKRYVHWRKVLLLAIIILILLTALDVAIGSVYIAPLELLAILLGTEVSETSKAIILDFRLPRTITAMAAGMALSLSGLQMQTLFRNPLAGPFVLGISSGASFGVALLVMGTTLLPFTVGPASSVIAACIGAGTVLLIILTLAKKLRDSTSLLIIGLMFGSAVAAGVSILQYFGNPEQVQNYLFWTFGSFSGVTWEGLSIFIPVTLAGLLFSIVLAKPMNVMLLGDEYASTSGINIMQMRYLLILCTSVLAGMTTAFCGLIAFVGIAVPHIARLAFNTSNHTQLVPLVAFIGGGIMVLCDILTQLPGFSITIPINAVTSLLGAPLIIWLIIYRKKMAAF